MRKIALMLMGSLALASCGEKNTEAEKPIWKDLPIDQRYPGPWKEDFHVGITRALAINKIEGCGQYKYRQSSNMDNEYVVYCTRDGKTWVSYLVFPQIEKALGPYSIDPKLQ
jgi:hypothetical protein